MRQVFIEKGWLCRAWGAPLPASVSASAPRCRARVRVRPRVRPRTAEAELKAEGAVFQTTRPGSPFENEMQICNPQGGHAL